MLPTELLSDCARCAALCCVELAFDRSEAFAFDKPAGEPCRHLQANRCSVHALREESGLGGCVAYECFGAGPRATALGGTDAERRERFALLRGLHEAWWLLVSCGPGGCRSSPSWRPPSGASRRSSPRRRQPPRRR